jgi:hypothetical protein
MTIKVSSRSSRIPDVEKLRQDPCYRQILELDFNDMIPFVLSSIRKRSIISYFFIFVNLGLLLFIIVYILVGMIGSSLTWSMIIKQSLTGIVSGTILVIPFHEILHGLAYRILGARKIRIGADLQQFIFFVTADRYPVSGHELYFLAMTPFVVINITTMLIPAIWFPHVILFPAFLLLSHNIMCIGDFALVNYVFRAQKKVFTYDETEKKKSYFYEEIAGQPD